MRQLDELIDKINTDSLVGVTVFDIDKSKYTHRTLPATKIKEDFGTAEDFFEHLFATGHKNLRLIEKRKNGSVYKTVADFTVNFEVQPSEVPQLQHSANQPATSSNDPFANSFGLGTLDVMNLMVSKHEATRLFTENSVLLSENKENKKLIDEMKEERLKTMYDRENKKGNQEMLMGAIQAMPMLMQMVKGEPAQGLQAPQKTFDSETKQNFADKINHITDANIIALDSISDGLNNQAFSAELLQLLQKHQLWQA